MRLVSFLTDLHGDEQCPRTVEAALKSVAAHKPDLRIFGGDLCDLRFLRKGCSEDEKYANLEQDIGRGLEFLKAYKPNYWLLGNHDDRLWLNVDSPRKLLAYACERMVSEFSACAKEIGCEVVPYHIDSTGDETERGVLRLGPVAYIHGYEHSQAGLRREANEYWCRYVVQGHIHQPLTIAQGNSTLYGMPGLAKRFADWNSHRPAFRKHRKGWGWVLQSMHPGGWAHVSQTVEIERGRFLDVVPTKKSIVR